LTVIAALLGSGEPHVLAQRTKQRRANIERKPPLMRVDLKRHICGVACSAVELACSGGFRDQGARRGRRGSGRGGRQDEVPSAGLRGCGKLARPLRAGAWLSPGIDDPID
jgi:hypothetical protein